MKSAAVLLVTLTIFLTGCGGPQQVKQVEIKNPIDITADQKAKPILFRKIVIKLQRGTEIGRVYGGLLNIDYGPITWRGGRLTLSGDELTEVFREELEKANYPVVGDPDALFEDPSEWKAELLVAGLVTDLQQYLYFNPADERAEAYINVDWQIYSRLYRKVVYEITTEGNGKATPISNGGDLDALLNAFAVATRNLLADQGFYDLVVESQTQEKELDYEKIEIAKVKEYDQQITSHVNHNRAAVVTIFAGDGHGSGFFISKNGYLLTNNHVVGEAKLVTIKLATGRELLGEVIRKNPIRDVALLKTEEEGMTPMPIRKMSVNSGENVYAIGTPLDEDFNTTLSKGIVSSFRDIEGNKFIQSDVNILPGNSGGPLMDDNGNAIGLAATIYVGKEQMLNTGLNFFIPIDSALNALNIDITADSD